jgi:nucleotide-binding universal stress UspA family protein
MEAKERSENDQTQPMKILLAYDGSEHAQAAVELLSDLPLTQPAVTLIAVLPPQRAAAQETMLHELDAAKARLETKHMQVTSIFRTGHPAAVINAYAEEIQTDLILMGAKGLRATLGIFLGGVAQQVVEYSKHPVLVVRAPYQGLKRILAVTDGSEYSKKAVEYLAPVCSKGKRNRCSWLPADVDLCIMHVLPPPIPPDLAARAWAVGPEVIYPAPAPPIDTKKLEKDEEDQGRKILEEATATFEEAGFTSRSVMPRGDAATEILAYAKENRVDLIVCGSRGLSEITGWLLGSVSRKLVHYAGYSVLIVK